MGSERQDEVSQAGDDPRGSGCGEAGVLAGPVGVADGLDACLARGVYVGVQSPIKAGPQLLFQALGASNLRAYVQGQDDRGGCA